MFLPKYDPAQLEDLVKQLEAFYGALEHLIKEKKGLESMVNTISVKKEVVEKKLKATTKKWKQMKDEHDMVTSPCFGVTVT